MADDSSFPALVARLRHAVPAGAELSDSEEEPDCGIAAADGGWRADLRLFTITFAGGFLFFLVFLA